MKASQQCYGRNEGNMKCIITSGASSQSFTCRFSHQYTSSSLQKFLHLASVAAFEYNTSLAKGGENASKNKHALVLGVLERFSCARRGNALRLHLSVRSLWGQWGDAARLQIEYVLKMNNFRNGDGVFWTSISELRVVLLTSGRHARTIFRPTPPDLPKPK